MAVLRPHPVRSATVIAMVTTIVRERLNAWSALALIHLLRLQAVYQEVLETSLNTIIATTLP
jgi:hypothetical protein